MGMADAFRDGGHDFEVNAKPPSRAKSAPRGRPVAVALRGGARQPVKQQHKKTSGS